jgi:hypothetical protein
MESEPLPPVAARNPTLSRDQRERCYSVFSSFSTDSENTSMSPTGV